MRSDAKRSGPFTHGDARWTRFIFGGAAALADKTRLLVIAEAWLELAERVTRKDGNAKHRNGASSEHLLVTSVLDSSESTLGPNGSAPSGRSSGTSSAA
jgi:hypothetical protein